MSNNGKKIRLSRILRAQRASLVIAFDHALVLGPIPGTGDPAGQIRRFIDGGADAILMNLGLMRYCADAPCAMGMPGLIARLDWTTGLTSQPTSYKSCLIAHPEEALRMGADAVITYLVIGTGDTDFETNELTRTAQVARECETVGIPLIVESVARGPRVDNPAEPKWLKTHTRMAAELGADVIKTDYTGDPDTMREVVQSCPIPILVLGGSRAGSDQDALATVRGIVSSGAAGVFFGRNVFQADDMNAFLKQARVALGNSEYGGR